MLPSAERQRCSGGEMYNASVKGESVRAEIEPILNTTKSPDLGEYQGRREVFPVTSRRMLVAGGAGFIGSHLCERLVSMGHQVLCVDNLHTGSERNVSDLRANPSFQFRMHDVIDPIEAEAAGIFNLACPAAPFHYQRDPIRTARTTVYGAFNLLELAKRLGVPILQASTSEVYGDPEVHPQEENYAGRVNPIGPRACYDEGKRCAETLFFDFRRQYDLSIKVVRIFNTYGPRMNVNDGRVVPNFITQALQNQPITLYGDGTHTRSFCYVDDLVDGLIAAMATSKDVTGPINLGNPVEISVRELAERVTALTGSRSSIVHRPLPADDPARRRPDITRARTTLGWEPRISLEEGLTKTIAYFQETLMRRTIPARRIELGQPELLAGGHGQGGI